MNFSLNLLVANMTDPQTLILSKNYSENNEKNQPKDRPVYELCKRMFDFLSSLIALILLLPFLIIIGLIIFIDDPKGSPIFSQTRVGKDGKEFKLYKFRTMQVDAEERLEELLDQNEADEVVFKIKNDPRITRVGTFLRKTSLDELPQLYNIVRGDMSIVGPRPPLVREVVQYNERQMKRLSVKPGLTCLWQIQKNRNDITFDQWIDLDLEYIKNRNMLLDLMIIFKTFSAVVNAQGR